MRHVHRCPNCYEDVACDDPDCSVEHDDEDDLRGAFAICDACDDETERRILLTVDTGASGAFAWDDGSGPRVRSLTREIRYLAGTKNDGTHKRRSYASHAALIDDVRCHVLGRLQGLRSVRLFALIEVTPPLPEQSAQATASQARSVGRIEAALAALGFEVYEETSRAWRKFFGLRGGATHRAATDQARVKRANKEASRAKARELFSGQVSALDLKNTDRCEALLMLQYFKEKGLEEWQNRGREQKRRAKVRPKKPRRLSPKKGLARMRALETSSD